MQIFEKSLQREGFETPTCRFRVAGRKRGFEYDSIHHTAHALLEMLSYFYCFRIFVQWMGKNDSNKLRVVRVRFPKWICVDNL